MADAMEKIVSLCKRRGFIFPGSEIYGGLANSWDYGPLGVELKNNIKNLWWDRFVHRRDDIVGIDSALIMNPKVWEASGHLKNFSDFLSECKTDTCHNRIRIDEYLPVQERDEFNVRMAHAVSLYQAGDIHEAEIAEIDTRKWLHEILLRIPCPVCKKRNWTEPKPFYLMFTTFVGPTRDEAAIVYLRPETAQGMFVDFKNVLDTTRKTLPFGIAQIGKAFRNEITPGNFIFRTREFEQMEIEYFIPVPKSDKEWQKYFKDWQKEMWVWITEVLGLDKSHVHELEIPDGERAHYSKRTIDFEYDFPFGRKELYGLAYRTDFDLKNHFKEAPYQDKETGEKIYPHVVEPTWGVDRSVLAVLCDSYAEDNDRTVLKLPISLAPYKAAVFPLLANKPELIKLARKIYEDLRGKFMVAWDERGNIGKRYYAQDEIGTPYCITVDFDSVEKGDVTVRDRDTAKQERVKIAELGDYLREKVSR
ncbi:MAG: glycine--tRNA ligase [Candidatus Liptonbacteria bacterium]|nr:glycine--tRNA ligase [Candidatus Liptonbacteria bacterium]